MTFHIDEFSLFTNQSHHLYKAALIFAIVRCIISWILNFIKSDSDTNSAANSISAQMIRDSLEVTTYGDLELEAWSSSAAAGDEFCAVCLNRLEEKDSVKRLRCCHVFHADCIDEWIEFDNECVTCPLCRAALVGPNGLQFGVIQSETSWAVERMLYILGDEDDMYY